MAAICLLAFVGKAQNVVHDKYYVGVDLHWIWSKYNTNPSLSFKIIDSKRKKSGNFSSRKGWRFRLNAYYDKLAGLEQVIPGMDFPTHRAVIGFYPGYEWHKSYKMFDFFYGFDFLIGAESGQELVYWNYLNNTNPQWDRWAYWTQQHRIGGGSDSRIVHQDHRWHPHCIGVGVVCVLLPEQVHDCVQPGSGQGGESSRVSNEFCPRQYPQRDLFLPLGRQTHLHSTPSNSASAPATTI